MKTTAIILSAAALTFSVSAFAATQNNNVVTGVVDTTGQVVQGVGKAATDVGKGVVQGAETVVKGTGEVVKDVGNTTGNALSGDQNKKQ